MPNPTRIEINCETGEVLEIELTDEEVAIQEAQAAEFAAAREAQEAEKAAAKAAVLSKLGITEDELRAALA
jgi:bifunctional DNA-binding transcriptional regulator/antitoxin component of YhaV-PrlF toxin-antitoxin module